jgi:hypothetical protein
MSAYDDNPFVRFGLDPEASLAELTERLRELAEDASEADRVALRAAFESLGRSPARRLELVLEAGPAPEPLPPRPAEPAVHAWPAVTLAQVIAPAPLAPRLSPETDAERAAVRLDLTFLVRTDEAAVTGVISRRKTR